MITDKILEAASRRIAPRQLLKSRSPPLLKQLLQPHARKLVETRRHGRCWRHLHRRLRGVFNAKRVGGGGGGLEVAPPFSGDRGPGRPARPRARWPPCASPRCSTPRTGPSKPNPAAWGFRAATGTATQSASSPPRSARAWTARLLGRSGSGDIGGVEETLEARM
jgi:hypothetical protein